MPSAYNAFSAKMPMVHLVPSIPFEGAVTTLTPTALSATVCRVFPFPVVGNLILNRVIIKTPAALANGYQFGIFDDQGARLWTSGPATTTANYTTLTAPALPLLPGVYFFAVTNNGAVSATAALQVCAPLMAASLPAFGTVPATLGVMPASINPAAITKTVGGWPIYVTLSEWI